MNSLSYIARKRREHRGTVQRSFASRLGLFASVVTCLVVISTATVLIWGYTNLTKELPSLSTLPLLLQPPEGLYLQPTRFYDRKGEKIIYVMENPAAAGRNYLVLDGNQPERLPQNLVNATIAAADPSFWEHTGYSLQGLFGGGHPTLAQRLVFEHMLKERSPGLRRNIQERLLAAQATSYFGKEKVLEWYLNYARYGDLVFGADAAARVYFGKPATELSLGEATLLAAVAEAPAISPLDATPMVLARQQEVVHLMLRQGLISSEEAQQAAQEDFQFREENRPEDLAPAFTSLVFEQLATQFPVERIEMGGLQVYTSLDYELHIQVACTVAMHVLRLNGNMQDVPTIDGALCEAARLLPSLRLAGETPLSNLEASAIVLDPHTGQVLSLVGDPLPGLNPLLPPGRPAGTLMNTFIYLAAFTRGLSPASLAWDIPYNPFGEEESQTTAQFHGPVRLRTAFVNDYPATTEQLLAQVGFENIQRTVRQFGLFGSSELPIRRSEDDLVSLQSYDATLLEMAQAFGIFANQGILAGRKLGQSQQNGLPETVHSTSILRVTDIHGALLLDWSTSEWQAVASPQLAHLLTHVLSDETARWPTLGHPNPLEIGRPAAAKIGQTNPGQDSWTVGYIPQMVVGTWVGSQNENSRIPLRTAPVLWHAIIQYASRKMPTMGWDMPAGLSVIEVCDPSGLLPTSYCPTVVPEVFISGNEPTQADTLYRVFQINRETGRLATIFTPTELVEERVYLVVPPEASQWAERAGLPMPPNSYDVIYAPTSGFSDSKITFPEMFAHVGGQVSIQGTASGEGFDLYRLQAGKGLNPQHWVQIGEVSSAPLEDGQLATWDTEGLSGLYALQLMVVRQDQRVDTGLIQVTVDNQPPEVLILNPSDGQEIKMSADAAIVFQVNATDDLVLSRVEFYLDEHLVASLVQGPFTVAWQPRQGEHKLWVRAVDLAGNENQATVEFSVVR